MDCYYEPFSKCTIRDALRCRGSNCLINPSNSINIKPNLYPPHVYKKLNKDNDQIHKINYEHQIHIESKGKYRLCIPFMISFYIYE